jgi:hypothetical protein
MQTIVLAAVVVALAGCAAPFKQSFEPRAAGTVRTIALVEPVEPEGYVALDYGHPAMYMGLVSGIVTGSHLEEDGRKFTAHLRRAGFEISRRLGERTAFELERRGYYVRRVSHADYATGVDAVLTLEPRTVGYVAPRMLTDYIPALSVVAELMPPGEPGAGPLYRDGFIFGWQSFSGWWVNMPSPKEYSYRNFADLIKRSEEAADGLWLGADRIAERIASDFAFIRSATGALSLSH